MHRPSVAMPRSGPFLEAKQDESHVLLCARRLDARR